MSQLCCSWRLPKMASGSKGQQTGIPLPHVRLPPIKFEGAPFSRLPKVSLGPDECVREPCAAFLAHNFVHHAGFAHHSCTFYVFGTMHPFDTVQSCTAPGKVYNNVRPFLVSLAVFAICRGPCCRHPPARCAAFPGPAFPASTLMRGWRLSLA